MPKPENLTLQVAKHYADLHQTKDPEFPVSVLGLRKVAERALSDWKKATFPGADPTPWLNARIETFLKALDGQGETADLDLLPAKHPLAKRAASPDPWQELVSAEERMSALQKQLVDTVTRADVRKADETSLIQLNRRLAHLFTVNFAKNMAPLGVSGVPRQRVVEAAALVHEELERRGVPVALDEAELYQEAIKARAEPRVTVHEGALLQRTGGVVIKLESGELFVPGHRLDGVPLAKAAERFTPAGSALHTPFSEPREAPYVGLTVDQPSVDIGKFAYSIGAKTDAFTELFVSGALSGVLVVGKSSVMLRKSVVPYVLTQSAMKTGYMPPEGESALPPSLEWDVPPELRYWKAACGQDPREIRDQLVQAQLFTEDSVRIVDDVPRRTFTKLFIAEPFPAAPDVFAELLAEARPEAALFKAYVGTPDAFVAAVTLAKDGLPSEAADNMPAALFLFYADEPPPLVEDVDQCTDKFLVGARDTQETRERFEKVGRPFHLAGVDSHIFVASHPVPGEVTYLETVLPVANESAEAAIGKCEVHVLKATADEDEHYVLGIVLEPETVDSQQDVYSVAEVRKSAYRFMAFHQNVGLMHKSIVNDQVRIVESYVAPVDCEIGGQTVKQGTWLMGVIVEDDALWGEVKSGAFTGFSIGGSAVRTAEDTAA